ncbi:DUF2267 domain-containing protein [Streptomyces sp. NPDC052309]|uniref:DUF2267 domain-containing protein n=1 Tax=Streptomyces griseicoloratus TaxID=2752516 RepID=A0A926L2D4_9ACTN|nr:DUF2267 domain-containing protein [Streptomyces griseicoloratus]MBD0421277.1 DUF2267 domain-containing protein [Streptomyces griseicoloratus]
MKYADVVRTVQEQSRSVGREEAEATVKAVLRTLAERLPEGLAGHLVAQLPHELADEIRSPEGAPGGPGQPSGAERFGLTAFAGRVAWRAGIDEEAALQRSAVVLNVLDAVVSPEQMTKVAGALPPDIRELLPTTRAVETEV